MATASRAGLGRSQELFWVSLCGNRGSSTRGPSSTAVPCAPARSWIGNGEATTRNSFHTRCQHFRQWDLTQYASQSQCQPRRMLSPPGNSRWWPKYLVPCHPRRRYRGSFRFLAPACTSAGCYSQLWIKYVSGRSLCPSLSLSALHINK